MNGRYNNSNQHPELSSLAQRTQHPMAHYWRLRTQTLLDRLERQARRMFQLEEDLSAFAKQYYHAVGTVTERLAQVEQRLATSSRDEMVATMPTVMAQRDASDARRSELKTRYRALAKEVHPDRAMVVDSAGTMATTMHALNSAYHHGDLAAVLRIEAQLLLAQVPHEEPHASQQMDSALRDIERAAETYAEGYRSLLNSPLNELMLRSMSAQLAGWDWMQAVVRKVERTIEEKERAAAIEHIEQIGAWRDSVQVA
jgi:hypothetical protein